MPRLMNIPLLFFLSFPAWAAPSGQSTLSRSCAGGQISTACVALLPHYANSQAVAGGAPLTTGSSIGIVSTTNESSVVNTIPHMATQGASQGSGDHRVSVTLTGPGAAAAGGYTQSIADVKTSLFHLGYMTRISTDSSNSVKDYSWATATSMGAGQTTLKATGSASSSTSAFVSAGGITAAASGGAVSTAMAAAAFRGPGTASLSTVAWSSSASHAQVVLNNSMPVSSSASTINQAGGYSQASVSSLSARQSNMNTHSESHMTGVANMPGPGSNFTNRPESIGGASSQPTTVPIAGVFQTALHPHALSVSPVTQMVMSGKITPAATAPTAKEK